MLSAANYRLLLNDLMPQSVNDLGGNSKKIHSPVRTVNAEQSLATNAQAICWFHSDENGSVTIIDVNFNGKDTIWHFNKKDVYGVPIFDYSTKNDSLTKKYKETDGFPIR